MRDFRSRCVTEARNLLSPEAATALSELIDATRIELEAAKEPQDQESTLLRDGAETRVFATHRYARFPTTVDVRLVDGASRPQYAGEVPYSATVIATDPQTVTLKFSARRRKNSLWIWSASSRIALDCWNTRSISLSRSWTARGPFTRVLRFSPLGERCRRGLGVSLWLTYLI